MNKRLILIVAIALLITSGVAFLVTSSGGADTSRQSATLQQGETADQESTISEQPSPNSATGSYINYDQSSFANTSGTRLLFFHASWCPQCRDLDTDINQSSIPSGTTIFKVDFDTSQDLRQQYGVTLQTTVVKVDASGNAIAKFVAYDDPTLEAVLQNLES